MSEVKIADFSHWNAGLKYNLLPSLCIYGAILRVTEQNNQKDRSFDAHVAGLKANNIPIFSSYKYSYGLTIDAIRNEANQVVNVLKQYPEFNGKIVWLDLEDSNQLRLGRATLMKFAEEFKSIVERAGYRFGIYCSSGVLDSIIDTNKVNYDLWLAAYSFSDDGSIPERLRPKRGQKGWQFSSKFKIGGQNCDMSVFDKDWVDKIMKTSAEQKTEPIKNEEKSVDTTSVLTADDVINVMKGWLGMSRSAGTHKPIIDLYNSHKPLARGYAVTYTDDYCDTTVSAVFIKLNAVDMIGGTECGVEEHVKLFQKKGIWIEDGTIVPKRGDIIVFNWDQNYQQNNGWSDHIGFVEYVEGNTIHTIEGNANGGKVTQRTFPVGHGQIRGFARPKYAENKASSNIDVKLENTKKVDVYVSEAEIIDAIVDLAASEVGYTEKDNVAYIYDKTGHSGSGNITKYNEELHKIQPSNMDRAAAWCDAFVDWLFYKTFGIDLTKQILCGDFDDYTYNSVNLYKQAGRWTNTPKRGYQIFFGGSGHTGLVYQVSDGKVYTIEGNTSNAVRYREYPIDYSSIIGYGMPKYNLAVGQPKNVSGNITPVTPTPSPSPSPSPTPSSSLLKKGSKGAEVRKMQEMLITIGFSCGSYGADSDFGTSTEKALLAFQKYYGLEQDGIYGTMSASRLLVEYQKYPRQVKIVKKAYIREQPSGTSTNLETLKTGVTIEIIGRAFAKNGKPWYTAKTIKGQIGYINGEKVSGI